MILLWILLPLSTHSFPINPKSQASRFLLWEMGTLLNSSWGRQGWFVGRCSSSRCTRPSAPCSLQGHLKMITDLGIFRQLHTLSKGQSCKSPPYPPVPTHLLIPCPALPISKGYRLLLPLLHLSTSPTAKTSGLCYPPSSIKLVH